MILTEQQLRSVVRETIAEAIANADMRMANRYTNSNAQFSRDHGTEGNLVDYIFQGAKKLFSRGGQVTDVDGYFDILKSANDIWPLINRFNAEISNLKKVYNYLNRKQNGGNRMQGGAQQNVAAQGGVQGTGRKRGPMSPEQKQQMAATRAQNAQMRQAIRDRYNAQYGTLDPNYEYVNQARGAADPRLAQKLTNNIRSHRVSNAQMAPGWLGSMNEGFMGGDPIDNIMTNYKTIEISAIPTSLQQLSARISEYQAVVQKLQGLLNKWTGADGSNAIIRDKNADARAAMEKELAAVGRRNRNVQKQALEESVDGIMRLIRQKLLA